MWHVESRVKFTTKANRRATLGEYDAYVGKKGADHRWHHRQGDAGCRKLVHAEVLDQRVVDTSHAVVEREIAGESIVVLNERASANISREEKKITAREVLRRSSGGFPHGVYILDKERISGSGKPESD